MENLSIDVVSLPIIVTDWDAISESKKHVETPTQENDNFHTASKVVGENQILLNMTESLEEIWSRISDKLKAKLREAAVEVLRQTEPSLEKSGFQYYDDARFLD